MSQRRDLLRDEQPLVIFIHGEDCTKLFNIENYLLFSPRPVHFHNGRGTAPPPTCEILFEYVEPQRVTEVRDGSV
jgi:hypothetical protein